MGIDNCLIYGRIGYKSSSLVDKEFHMDAKFRLFSRNNKLGKSEGIESIDTTIDQPDSYTHQTPYTFPCGLVGYFDQIVILPNKVILYFVLKGQN